MCSQFHIFFVNEVAKLTENIRNILFFLIKLSLIFCGGTTYGIHRVSYASKKKVLWPKQCIQKSWKICICLSWLASLYFVDLIRLQKSTADFTRERWPFFKIVSTVKSHSIRTRHTGSPIQHCSRLSIHGLNFWQRRYLYPRLTNAEPNKRRIDHPIFSMLAYVVNTQSSSEKGFRFTKHVSLLV